MGKKYIFLLVTHLILSFVSITTIYFDGLEGFSLKSNFLLKCYKLLYLKVAKIVVSAIPSEEFELTANSLGAHFESHGKGILRTLSYLTVNSLDDSHCELAVSLL